MAASLKSMIDTGKFINFVNSFGFNNFELDQIGVMLSHSEGAHQFVRNASLEMGYEKGEFLAAALANSVKKESK